MNHLTFKNGFCNLVPSINISGTPLRYCGFFVSGKNLNNWVNHPASARIGVTLICDRQWLTLHIYCLKISGGLMVRSKRIAAIRLEADTLVKALILDLYPKPQLNYVDRIPIDRIAFYLKGIQYRVQQINGGAR